MKSTARAELSRLIEERGIDGSLLVPKSPVKHDESEYGENTAFGTTIFSLCREPERDGDALPSPTAHRNLVPAVGPPPPAAPFYEAFALPHAPGLWPEYGVVCVSDEEGDAEQCGDGLPSATRAGWVDEWMRRHSYETGHARFRRTVIDYATLEPPAEFAVRVVPGGRPKSPPNAAGAVRGDDRNRR
ncbi:hypothetical protein AB0I22_27000 [Streptomyces sp. NPDC050610]|uniref:hypothetical protein n=1 Tax=Streptomyces sp. NPDC050610 TaxID=3157097 RepID=UPI00342558B9